MKKYFKTLIAIIGLFIAIVLIINTSPFDETLDSEIVANMQAQPLADINNNAYYAILGINSALEKNTIDTGATIIARYQKNRKHGNDDISDDEINEILGINNNVDKQWLEFYGNCNANRDEDCLIKLSQLLLDTPINNPRLSLMLNRFDQVLNLTKYTNFNDITFGTPFPRYLFLLRLGNIKKAQLYNHIDRTGVLLDIDKEMKFWKMVLRDGEMIVDKMVAQANIRNNLYYLSTFLKYNKPTQKQSTLIQSILTPLNKIELDISNGYITESRSLFKALNEITIFDFEFSSLLLQKNAYQNLLYKYLTKPFTTLSKMSSKEIYQAIKSGYMLKLNQEKQNLVSYSPTSLYNFEGKSSIKGYCDNCWDYAVRPHDLNNIFNLVKLQFLLKTNHSTNTKDFIASSKIKNNYTGEPFVYEKKGNSVKFECLDPNYEGCSIKL